MGRVRLYLLLFTLLLAATGVVGCPYGPLTPRLLITGPTTVGKTAVVEGVANRTHAHVINGDKMYFFAGRFFIGLGMSASFDVKSPRNHLYRILDPGAEFLGEPEYAAKVAKVLDQVGDGQLVLFDGASKNYLTALDGVDPNIMRIGLKWPDGYNIRAAVEKRVDKAIKAGLIEETKRLMDSGLENSAVFQGSPVYKIVARHLKGEIDLTRMRQELADAGVNIAESQYRSLKKLPNVTWIESDPDHPEVAIKQIQDLLANGTGTLAVGAPVTTRDKTIRFYTNLETDLDKIKGPLRDGYDLAMARYREKYPHLAAQVEPFFRSEFKVLRPERSTYFTVTTAANAREVVGFGLLYDGRGAKTPASQLPAELVLPKLDMRTTAEGKPTENVFEVARAATKNPPGSLPDLLTATAEALKMKYDGAANIPADANVIAVAENQKLVDMYVAAGFRVKFPPSVTGRGDRWVLEYSGRKLCEDHGRKP